MTKSSLQEHRPPRMSRRLGGFMRDMWDALRGRSFDYTKGPINRAIILLAVPMVLEMCMESVFAVVDVYFVSRLGAEAVATVGLTEHVLTLVFAVAIGLSMATTAMVSRRIGEGKPDAARVVARQAVFLGVFVSLPIALVGMLFPEQILRLMGASESVVAVGSWNTRLMVGGNITIILLFLINAVFRGAGVPSVAMRALWLANGVNIILDPCFIFGWGPFPELGVTGAAVATNIGRGTGVLFQLWALYRGVGPMRIRWRDLRIDTTIIARLFRLSLGGTLQWSIATMSWIALTRIVAEFGDEALAGYTIGVRVIVFAILPAWGLSNAAATLVGQNLGAGQPDRAARSVWFTCVYNMAFLGSVGLTFILAADTIVSWFTNDPATLRHGIDTLRYVSYGYLFFAVGMVMTNAFNGAGDTRTPTRINFFCYWLFQIPVAFLLAIVWDFGPKGVFLAIAGAESMLALVGALLFRRGAWKTNEV